MILLAYPVISIDDINVLKPATEAQSLAATAILEQDKAAITRLINYAVVTGEVTAIWQHTMSAELKSFLETQGYQVSEIRAAHPGSLWLIAWG